MPTITRLNTNKFIEMLLDRPMQQIQMQPDIELEFLQHGKHDMEKYEEIKNRKRTWAQENDSRKEKLIFHGGCLSCETPLKSGIGTCIFCQYFNADWSLQDLSEK